jgi:hypothetical protein
LWITSPQAPTQDPIFDTGKVFSSATTVNVPFGVIKDASWTYRIHLRVWDTVYREAISGDPGFVEIETGDLPVTFSGAVSSPTGLTFGTDLLLPTAELSWTHSAAPAYYQLLRSDNGGITYQYIKEAIGSSLNVGGTNYEWNDNTAPTNKNVKFRVVAVNGSGVQSAGPIADGAIRRVAPVLMAPDSTLPVLFLNPDRSMAFGDVQGVHEVLDGPPVLVTQKLGRHRGSLSGRMTDDLGFTAEEQLANFLAHREMTGAEVLVGIANRTFRAFAYNFNYDIITDSEGVTYFGSFDWMEI